MLKPSYAELMDIMNKDNESGDDIKSRYTVVIAAAKRARQIIEGDKSMVDDSDISDKPLSIAVKEIEKGKIKVVPEGMGTPIHIEKPDENKDLGQEMKNELESFAKQAEGEPNPDEDTFEPLDGLDTDEFDTLDEIDGLDELDELDEDMLDADALDEDEPDENEPDTKAFGGESYAEETTADQGTVAEPEE